MVVLDMRQPLRFCRGLCLGSRLSFFLCQEKRDGLRYLAFLFRRVEIAIRAFSRCRCGYLPWRVHFGFVRFFMAISTGYRGRGGTESAVRCGCAWRESIGFDMLSAGRTLGLRAPDCAKESSTLWTLFTLRRGCVGAGSPRRHPGTIGDLTGSNLWPGRSCGRSNIAVRTIA